MEEVFAGILEEIWADMIRAGVSRRGVPAYWLQKVLRLGAECCPGAVRLFSARVGDGHHQMVVVDTDDGRWVVELVVPHGDPRAWTGEDFVAQPFVAAAFDREGGEGDDEFHQMIRRIVHKLGYGRREIRLIARALGHKADC
jgi:hypothetical protein